MRMVKKNYTPLPSGVVQRKILRALRTDFFLHHPCFLGHHLFKILHNTLPRSGGDKEKVRGISQKNFARFARKNFLLFPPLSNCVLRLCLTLYVISLQYFCKSTRSGGDKEKLRGVSENVFCSLRSQNFLSPLPTFNLCFAPLLNAAAVCHSHQDLFDGIDMIMLRKECCERSEYREIV